MLSVTRLVSFTCFSLCYYMICVQLNWKEAEFLLIKAHEQNSNPGPWALATCLLYKSPWVWHNYFVIAYIGLSTISINPYFRTKVTRTRHWLWVWTFSFIFIFIQCDQQGLTGHKTLQKPILPKVFHINFLKEL